MSQQGSGGYGGGGPYGPPGGGGYGGPPQGGGYPPGAPPGGYGPPGQPPGGYGGPPGYGPPGYGPPGAPPPGYGPPQYGGHPGGPPGQPPPKKSNVLIWVLLGVGLLVLLGIGGAVASFLYVRNQATAAEQQLAAAASGVAAGVATAVGTVNGGAPASAACASAIACCKVVVARSGGQNAALIEQACGGLAALSDAVCVQQYDAQKRAATLLGLSCP